MRFAAACGVGILAPATPAGLADTVRSLLCAREL